MALVNEVTVRVGDHVDIGGLSADRAFARCRAQQGIDGSDACIQCEAKRSISGLAVMKRKDMAYTLIDER